MPEDSYGTLRQQLEQQKSELSARLERIKANLRRGYHADSKERAKERIQRSAPKNSRIAKLLMPSAMKPRKRSEEYPPRCDAWTKASMGCVPSAGPKSNTAGWKRNPVRMNASTAPSLTSTARRVSKSPPERAIVGALLQSDGHMHFDEVS